MTQESFEFETHAENLERVSARIAPSIVRFCLQNRRFHADELREAVVRETGVSAPGSADRILRDLRQRGVISYRVVSRRESLYEVTSIGGKPV